MQKITNRNKTASYILILLVLIHYSCRQKKPVVSNDPEVQLFNYQKSQFNNPDSGYITPYLNNFKILNREILRYRDADQFWMAITFRISDKLFEALYVSNTDTVIYSLEKDSVIQYRHHQEYLQNYKFLIDKVLKDEDIPLMIWTGPPTKTMVMNINLQKTDIIIERFNLDEYSVTKKRF